MKAAAPVVAALRRGADLDNCFTLDAYALYSFLYRHAHLTASAGYALK